MSSLPSPSSLESGAPARFEWEVRVYYEDTDAGGVVFYANYLKFFERARTEWLRSAGISQLSLAEKSGLIFMVRHTAVDYLKPAQLDDVLMIVSSVEKPGRASVDFYQQAFRVVASGNSNQEEKRELLATGSIKVACVGRANLRPTAIPEFIRTLFLS